MKDALAFVLLAAFALLGAWALVDDHDPGESLYCAGKFDSMDPFC